MAIQYANLTYSFVVDDYVDLPAGVPPGQLAYVVNTAKAYYSTNGIWKEVLLAGAGGFQPYTYSFDNPPASPSAYDDEFNATTLNPKWTAYSGYTGVNPGVNTPVSGTVNPFSSLTTPVYDLDTWPSWMLTQSEETTGGSVPYSYAGYYQSYTPATNETFFFKVCGDYRNFNSAQEGIISLMLLNTGDSNEQIGIKVDQTGTTKRAMLWVLNNGSLTNAFTGNINEASGGINFYLCLWKSGNTYYGGLAHGNTVFAQLGPVTKTGVTTFDRFELRFGSSDDTPSIISGIDFFRYYPSITYALMN